MRRAQRIERHDIVAVRLLEIPARAGEPLNALRIARTGASWRPTLFGTYQQGRIALTDNVVRYATHRYCDNPLIVQGPGAGPEVTAGGVFADLLRVAAYLGARL